MTDHYIDTGVWHRLLDDLAYPEAPDPNDPELTRREEIAQALAHAGIWPDAIEEDRDNKRPLAPPAAVNGIGHLASERSASLTGAEPADIIACDRPADKTDDGSP